MNVLKQHGYCNRLVGKWHALKAKEYISQAFHHIRNYYNKHWFVQDGKWRHVTELNQHDAIEFLQTQPKDQRFALMVYMHDKSNHHHNDGHDNSINKDNDSTTTATAATTAVITQKQ